MSACWKILSAKLKTGFILTKNLRRGSKLKQFYIQSSIEITRANPGLNVDSLLTNVTSSCKMRALLQGIGYTECYLAVKTEDTTE
jgi:hypothetical protein